MNRKELAGVVIIRKWSNINVEETLYFPNATFAEWFIAMIPQRQLDGDPMAMEIYSAKLGRGVLSAN